MVQDLNTVIDAVCCAGSQFVPLSAGPPRGPPDRKPQGRASNEAGEVEGDSYVSVQLDVGNGTGEVPTAGVVVTSPSGW